MIKPKQLIVAMTSGRSGSSMVCGLIAKHGVWTGKVKDGDKRNPDGFYENMEVYKACDHYGQFKKEAGIAENDGLWRWQFEDIVRSQGYEDGPLIIKHIPNCYPIWDDLDPTYITIRRNIEAQTASRKNINKSLPMVAIEGRERVMDYLEHNKDAVRIDSERIINGDYKQLAEALSRVNIKLDKKICRSFVNPAYWHF